MDYGLANGIYSNKLEGNATGIYDNINTGLHNGLYYNNNIGINTNGIVFYIDFSLKGSYPPPYNGTTSFDISVNQNNGIINGGASFSVFNRGCIRLENAFSQYIDYSNPSVLNFGTGNFTIFIWFRRSTNAATNLRIFSKGCENNTSTEAGFALLGTDTAATFAINPSGTRTLISNAITYNLEEWVCFCGVLERGIGVKTYKNAKKTQQVEAPTGSISGPSNFFIGRSSTSLFSFEGRVANCIIYNRALNDIEILRNYQSTKSRFNL